MFLVQVKINSNSSGLLEFFASQGLVNGRVETNGHIEQNGHIHTTDSKKQYPSNSTVPKYEATADGGYRGTFASSMYIKEDSSDEDDIFVNVVEEAQTGKPVIKTYWLF